MMMVPYSGKKDGSGSIRRKFREWNGCGKEWKESTLQWGHKEGTKAWKYVSVYSLFQINWKSKKDRDWGCQTYWSCGVRFCRLPEGKKIVCKFLSVLLTNGDTFLLILKYLLILHYYSSSSVSFLIHVIYIGSINSPLIIFILPEWSLLLSSLRHND